MQCYDFGLNFVIELKYNVHIKNCDGLLTLNAIKICAAKQQNVTYLYHGKNIRFVNNTVLVNVSSVVTM